MAKDNTSTPSGNQDVQKTDSFSWKDFAELAMRKWIWFACSLIFFVALGIVYILHTQPSYEREEEILIKSNSEGADISDIAGGFSSLGLFGSNTSVNNELIALTSPAVMYQVVDRLDLTMNYSIKETPLRWKVLWGTDQPCVMVFEDIDPNKSVGIRGYISPDLTIRTTYFYEIDREGHKIKTEKEMTLRPGETVTGTPIGKVTYRPNPNYKGTVEEESKFQVHHGGRQGTTELYVLKLNGELSDPDADVINLSIKDVSVQRADAILKAVVDVYNENWLSDKSRVALATSRFIEDRLMTLQQELGDVDSEIAQFQSEHKMTDFVESAKVTLEKRMFSQQAVLELQNILSMSQYLMDFVKNPQNANSAIPLITGIDDSVLTGLIADYDELVIQRNNIEANSSSTNPVVLDMTRQLNEARQNIIKNLEKQQMVTRNALAMKSKELGASETELTEAPIRSKQLLGVTRQQSVKQSLYLYLLQKREENELSQMFSADNTRIITPPYGASKPVAPKKAIIIAVMIILGLGLPGGLLYLKVLFTDTIQRRKDLEKAQTPFAGEIPYAGKKKRFGWLGRIGGKGKGEYVPLKAVKEGNRDAVNEAFRVIRSNIDLMNRSGEGCQTIMLTSFDARSGKSFIAYNLGVTFGLRHKKVLLVDCDLRHGSLSEYVGSPSKGLSNWLSGTTADWRSLLVRADENENVDVMPIGYRPPNPAELLEDSLFATFIKEAREEYDYIIFDCPPTDIVVDTLIVKQYVGNTLLVVRAGVFKKSQVPDIDELRESGKYPRVSLILNGTEAERSGSRNSYDYYSSK